jgi:coenzyme Q-binding protein COQ10
VYDIVSDVSSYYKFVPWCQESHVLKQYEDGMDAELVVGFSYFKEKYLSHVKVNKPDSVIATSNESNLFKYLRTDWKFSSASNPAFTWVSFSVEFKFESQLYNKVSELFMLEIINKMVEAFEKQCKIIYGESKRAIIS